MDHHHHELKQRSPFLQLLRDYALIALGCAVFGLGFDLFMAPHSINVGGVSGLAMLIVELTGGFGTVGLYTALLNVPLFFAGFKVLGRRFFFGSLFGMVANALFLDVFATLPVPQTEPLLGALFGGAMSGIGIGLVFMGHASTGGTDIIARLLKQKFRDLKMGRLMLMTDLVVVSLTGLVFRDLTKVLYSIVILYVSTEVVDAILYGLDYSTVALIITDFPNEVYEAVNRQVHRSVTFWEGRGGYTGAKKTVVMTAVSRNQVSELKQVVHEVDPAAFMILQAAHQVLGEGFKSYAEDI